MSALHSTTVADLRADVCVVGAGPAGLSIAAGLLGSGLRVIVLESGSRRPASGGEPYETVVSRGLPAQLEQSRVRGVGGSALHWDVVTPAQDGPRVRLRELDALDFEDRPGVRRPGWPFSRSTLEPFYRRARALMGLQPSRCDDDKPLGEVARACLFSFGPASTFTQVLPERLEADRDTSVVAGAVVTELHSSGPGTPVTSLRARGRQGESFTVQARAYVIAGGGIENPRLLLASRGSTPHGLGNEHDQVGRHFMAHPHYTSGLLVPTDDGLLRHTSDWDLVLRDGHPVQRKYALTEEVQRREGLLNIAYWVEPRQARRVVPLTRAGRRDARGMSAVRHVRRMIASRELTPGAVRDLATLTWAGPAMAAYAVRQARAERARRAGRPPHAPLVFTLGAMAEQQPRPDSLVRLGSGVDRFGVPTAELVWRVGQADADAMCRTHELLAPALARALAVRSVALLSPGELPGLGTGAHHMGTTRMSHRPEDGVVDADSRVHGVPNLFIAGSSVFPTGGAANPTLTIVALALRLSELLSKELRTPTTTR